MKNLYKIQDELYIVSDKEKSSYCIKECSMARLNIDRCDCQIFTACSNKVGNIILTTNKLLIKDGVQAIDDEFLEWFVKNPSCEFVKIYYRCDKSGCYLKEWNTCCKEAKPVLTLFAENESKAKCFREQEIIIPKEEPCDNCNNDVCCCIIKEEPKQETLEEAAKNYGWRIKRNTFSDAVKANELAESAKQDFIAGAKWQQEQNKNLYSEEEARGIWKAGQEYFKTSGNSITFEELTEQFKKK